MPEDKNLIEKLLASGFERFNDDGTFNPKNNWMGLSVYQPYESFSRGKKRAEFSLELYNTYQVLIYTDGRPSQKIPISERLIRFWEEEKIIYETTSGVIPPKEIQEKFIYA